MIYKKYNEPAAFVNSATWFPDDVTGNHVAQPCIRLKVGKDFIANPGKNPIFAARAEAWNLEGEHVGIKGSNLTNYYTTGGGDSGGKNWTYQTNSTYGYLNSSTKNFSCWLNWPEAFGNSKGDFHTFMDGEYGGGFYFSFSAYRINNPQKQYIWNTKGDFYDSAADDPDYLVLSGKNFNLNKWNDGFPAYMGGQIILKTSESFPNSNKLINIGFKGINRCYGSGNNSIENFSWKSYKFDTGKFKSLGNNYYLFNDDKIAPFKSYNSSLDANDKYHFEFVGPFFFKSTGSVYKYDENSNKVDKKEILDSSQIVPELICSVATLNEEDDLENTIIAEPAKSAYIGAEPSNYNIWNSDSKTYINTYCDPGFIIGYNPKNGTTNTNNPLYYTDKCKKIKFGKSASVFSHISKIINTNEFQLEEIQDWKYCTNWNSGSSSFTNCKKLKTIPNSWEGLESLILCQGMFSNCTSLTTLPDVWSQNGKGLINIKQIDSMFSDSGITEIKSFTGFKVTGTCPGMFQDCEKLEYLPENDWGDFTIAYGPSMFSGCTKLKRIPKSWKGFNLTTSSISGYTPAYIPGFLSGCTSLTRIESWDNFKIDTSIEWQLMSMFSNCTSLEYIGIDPNKLDSDGNYIIPDNFIKILNTYNVAQMFEKCTNLTKNYDPNILGNSIWNKLDQSRKDKWNGLFANIWTDHDLQIDYPGLFNEE